MQVNSPNLRAQQSVSSDVKASFFYVNDIHAQLSKVGRLKLASDIFTSSYNKHSIDSFKLSAGDAFLGDNPKQNGFVAKVLNMMGLSASTIGNHEIDDGLTDLGNRIKEANFKYLFTNLKVAKGPLAALVKQNKLAKSTIIEKNGHKYGFVGTQPTDLFKRSSKKNDLSSIAVSNMPETIKDLQNEVNKLKKQGVNKIILLSHLGFSKEQKVAQSVDGIDVIVGGHSHNLIKGVKSGHNYFNSPSGEPVVITQAGRDGNYYGVLDVVFDNAGKIKALNNDVKKTMELPKSSMVRHFADKLLGKSKNVGKVGTVQYEAAKVLVAENPMASVMLDGVRQKSGAEIVLDHSGDIRGCLRPGSVNTRDINDLSPFKTPLFKTTISEKDLIDALNRGAKSLKDPSNKPGILQTSGLKYTIGKAGQVTKASILQPNGSYKPINVNNPSAANKHVVVYNDFILGGTEGFTSLVKPESEIIERYNWANVDATADYLASLNKPLDIKTDGRIIVE